MRDESKLKYYEWHAPDLGTLGELESELATAPVVLDLGCGTGWLSHQIAEAGAVRVVGVDVDAGAIAVMNSTEDDRVEGVVALADALPFDAETFDLVVAKDIIEHMTNAAHVISEIYRVLRPGGKVYIATPSPQSRHFWDDYTHVRPFTQKALRAMLEDNNFEVETLYYSGNIPFVGRYMRLTGRNQLPRIAKSLARLRFLRNNVHAIAKKRR